MMSGWIGKCRGTDMSEEMNKHMDGWKSGRMSGLLEGWVWQ